MSVKPRRLLLGSGVVVSSSRNQAGDESAEQGFAASARVVHELEEAEVKRQLVLRDAAVRSQPTGPGRRSRLYGDQMANLHSFAVTEPVPVASVARSNATR